MYNVNKCNTIMQQNKSNGFILKIELHFQKIVLKISVNGCFFHESMQHLNLICAN